MTLIWAALLIALAIPIAAATMSPLLAWREPVYITAGFAGVVALGLMLVQPLLIGGYLPGLRSYREKRAHRWIGCLLAAAVMLHVAGLWITSPPDVIDALLFASPTPFSAFGVVAMWAIFAAAFLAVFRQRLRLRPRRWRLGHRVLVMVTVLATVIHALLIEGTMETISKAALCLLVVAATLKVVIGLWAREKRTATPVATP